MDGLLLVDKPKGWTSFDVVAKVRGCIRSELKQQGNPRKIKVGHTGTLDPLATGLLVLAIGSYTKKVPELTKQDKSYEASVKLGAVSTTDDAEGDISVPAQPTVAPTKEMVDKAIQSFIGTIEQVPPQFSAIKIGGVKSYDAARRGEKVTYQPRVVTIHSITDVQYTYPRLTFTCYVGSGTYVRSLARDIGEKLGTGAYLTDLRRTGVGDFKIDTAVGADTLNYDAISQNLLEL